MCLNLFPVTALILSFYYYSLSLSHSLCVSSSFGYTTAINCSFLPFIFLFGCAIQMLILLSLPLHFTSLWARKKGERKLLFWEDIVRRFLHLSSSSDLHTAVAAQQNK
jgi:hypothetical protein